MLNVSLLTVSLRMPARSTWRNVTICCVRLSEERFKIWISLTGIRNATNFKISSFSEAAIKFSHF